MGGRMGGKKLDRLVHIHSENFADRFLLEAHLQRFRVEARAMANVAQHFHVGKETHLDALHALALARGTASYARVEGKARGAPAAHARLARVREKPADRVPETDIGRRA